MKQEMVQSRNRLLKSSNFLFRRDLDVQNGKVLSRILVMTVIKRGRRKIEKKG